MIFNFPVFTLIFFAGGAICLLLAAALWPRRPAQGVAPLIYLLIAGAVWTLMGMAEAGAIDLPAKILCTRLMYFGVVSTGVFWLSFALDYSGSTWWKRPRNFLLLSIIPLVTLVLAWTNDYHGLLWSEIYLTSGPLGPTSVWKHGALYMLNPIYQYFLYAWGIFIICRYGLRRQRIFQKQVILILIATAIPVVSSILYVLGINPVEGYDFTPFFISLAAAIYAITIFRFQFMSVLPVAYQALVNGIPDGVLVLDPRGLVIEMNPAAEKALGQKALSLEGKSLASFWPELELVLAATRDFSHTELSTQQQNTLRYLDISAVTLLDSHKRFAGTLVIFRDISQIKKAQQRIEMLYDKEHALRGSLEEEINKRSQYSRAIVHELRAPLTSIKASSDILEEQLKEPFQQKLLQNIRRASLNLEQRVNELFDLARGELGLLKIEPAPFDMCRLIQDTAAEMEPVAAAKSLLLRTEVAAPELPVNADRSRLKQVINNLLGNALKFTDRGEIVIKAGPLDAGHLVVRVEDTGCGMERAELDNLFDPYRRKPREGGRSGLGIGLALSKIFVELHQGKIWAESTPGKGTAISFTIPWRNTPTGH
jgi:PAS domain S-box-containing protein